MNWFLLPQNTLDRWAMNTPCLFHREKAFITSTMLVVNSPPGTSKTTLQQSIVANVVVKHALMGGDPVNILAYSTNNQVVTSVIDSFSTVKPKVGFFYERWLLQLTGFGSYLSSESKVINPKVLHLERRQSGFHREVENGNPLIGDEAFKRAE
ncbi:hypothetical protein [Spirosoma oryzicola]|uniref:hypothetical protein n=1 Tax=Spirosoma oryzicola TaxID=2898794 RepID=UPI001E2E6D29|nr:hypothetical protein [Spirosoma oryzicola]UHG94373.1 hypothetical protein LQ777_27705 [Spirosoma oryzicola]